jgi:hypothetical protein
MATVMPNEVSSNSLSTTLHSSYIARQTGLFGYCLQNICFDWYLIGQTVQLQRIVKTFFKKDDRESLARKRSV